MIDATPAPARAADRATRGAMVLLVAAVGVELLWFAALAYLLYRVL